MRRKKIAIEIPMEVPDKEKQLKKTTTNPRKTIVRRITDAQYYTLLWILEHPTQYKNGEIVDLSIYDQSTIDNTVKKRCLYITDEENELVRDYLSTKKRHPSASAFVAQCGWKKDPKYVTKPIGSTIKYKQDDVKHALPIFEQVEADVLETPPSSFDESSKTVYMPPTGLSYGVYSDDERMRLAISLERTPVDKDTVQQCGLSYCDTVDMSQFLFIKDLNRQCQDVSDIDFRVLFYMLETRKINPAEAKMVLIKVGAGGVPEQSPSELIKYGLPKFYKDDPSITTAMLKAEQYSYKYFKMLAEEEPDSSYVFERFKDHIGFEKFPCIKHAQMCELQYSEGFEIKEVKINNDTVKVIYDDVLQGDEGVEINIKYNDRELLLNDFFCFEKTFKLNPEEKFNIWGEPMSINDYVRQLYEEYPHGIHGDFFATMKEAYEAGYACINEIA